jgi:hypothetical protein
MKHSELLRAAIPLLCEDCWGVGSIGLCAAVELAARTSKDGSVAQQIQKRIRALIHPYVWADVWLHRTHNVSRDELGSSEVSCEPTKEMQTWRRAWAEHLAQEYEAQGK